MCICVIVTFYSVASQEEGKPVQRRYKNVVGQWQESLQAMASGDSE